ncbi:MAG: phage tail tape measure protein [Pseudomonadota bacterium]
MTSGSGGQRAAVYDLAQAFSALRGQSKGFAADLAFDLKSSTEEIRRVNRETQSLSRSMGTGLRRAFDQAIFGGDKLSDVMKNLAVSLSRSALNSALKPVQNALGGGLNSLVAGGVGALFGFEKGGSFSAGRVRAFAKGGVVSGPTTFPMRGATGLMGEAGPEAIMPLTRGADGSLGVKAEGGAGANVTINIQTQDAESFRRSQGQISASIARAVQRGQRNL